MKKSKIIFKNKRMVIFFSLIVSLFILLSLRLYYLQVFKSDELTTNALNQRGKKISISSNRGIIFDRNLTPLTNNNKTKTLIITKEMLKKPSIYKNISKYTSLDLNELEEIKNKKDNILEIPLKKDVRLELLNKDAFLIDVVNRYNKKGILSHVIGYVNEYDNKGRSGIEKVYDEFLKIETKESFIVEYDRDRKLILGGSYNVNKEINPSNPAGVKLTIDYNIQKIVEKIMDKNRVNGSVIVGEVESGEILALASRPNFNPKNIKNYFVDKDMALHNKAIQITYPPGSVFKIVVFLAALEDNPSILDKNFFCKGYEEINGVKMNCNSIHGLLSLKEAFSKSCNSTFIQIAEELGGQKILDAAKRLGLEDKASIGLLEEAKGKLPTYKETYGAAIGNIAIGQGNLELTPLHITNLLMTIANDGISKNTTLIKGITNIDGKMIKEYFKESDKRLISSSNASILQEMLVEVVKTGTAKSMDLKALGGAGGKTGSSQARYNDEDTIHGWFSGFYPANNPKYVVTILYENAPNGSEDTLPIFEEIIKEIQ